MTPITCSIIKQYMWYHIKYKKWYDGNNIIVIYFKYSSTFYAIYENLNNENFIKEKNRYGAIPTEHIINNNVYYSFSFYKINEILIFEKLREDYNVFIIDIEQDKKWVERKECLKQIKKNSVFSNIWSSIIDTFYETTIMYNSDSSLDSSANSTQLVDKIKKIPSFDNMLLEELVFDNKSSSFEKTTVHNKNINSINSITKTNVHTNTDMDIECEEDFISLEDFDLINQNSINIKNINKSTNRMILEDELVTIKGKINIDSKGLMGSSEELVQIKRNPLDRTFSNIGAGKKITFNKK